MAGNSSKNQVNRPDQNNDSMNTSINHLDLNNPSIIYPTAGGYFYPQNSQHLTTNAPPNNSGYYQRFAQSPAPFYFASGYTDPNGFQDNNGYIDTGVLGYPSGGGFGKDFGYSYGNNNNNNSVTPSSDSTGGITYDQMYSQQQVGYGYGYYDPQYPVGYTSNSYLEDSFVNHPGHAQHIRINHGDIITPYSSELGSNENLCGGFSSGGTGNASPAPKTSITNLTVSEQGSAETCPSAAHVRPLDVITPELFQAIHAPTFYKTSSTLGPSQQVNNQPFYYSGGIQYGGGEFNGNNYGASHSGSASSYGSSGVYSTPHSKNSFNSNQHIMQPMYIPPINTISSISYQSSSLHHPRYQQVNDQSSTRRQTNENLINNKNVYTNGNKDLLPSIIGPDGQVHLKPTGSYASLITKALKESESGKMTLSGIYDWIKTNYPYYQSAEAAWQNSIRHNLSLNKCFKKVPRPTDEPGKGGFWALDYEYIKNQEISKRLNSPQGTQTADLDAFDSCSPAQSKDPMYLNSQSPYAKSSSQSRKRRNAEFEASKLLELLIPQEGWEDSVRVVASVVDEIYAATFEQQATATNRKQTMESSTKDVESNVSANSNNTSTSNNKRPKRNASSVPIQPSKGTREPKPYSSMASTMKLPTPILPNSSSGSIPSNRELHYHQYQPSVDPSSQNEINDR